jgi:hypothetical protein
MHLFIYSFYLFIYLFVNTRRTELEEMHFLRTVVREWGHEVAQLVEELRHKPEGHGFDSGWGRLSL